MSLFRTRPNNLDTSDAGLVIAALGGDREAFTAIVTRYQSLLCSLAYSSVGDLKHSEDIAQEAFIEAWKKLDTLRDPEKLKSWLCGILRFKVSRHYRKEARQPLKHADELDVHDADAPNTNTTQPNLEDSAIAEQEQALMWQTLAQLPENYRAPLILFYREQCSVELVAEKLELSESTAKQRLSRGRKLLQEAMVQFVEDRLTKSKPGAAFTLAVVAAIANIPAPAKAAALGTGAFKAGSALKWTSLLVVIASFSGVIGSFFSLRATLDQSRTAEERRRAIQTVILFFVTAFVFVLGMFGLRYTALQNTTHAGYFAAASQLLVVSFVAYYFYLLFRLLTQAGKFRAEQRILHPEAFLTPVDDPKSTKRDYISRLSLLGVPLVHFKLGMAELGEKPAFAWIAGGDRAYGLLFAWGGLAIAPISVGIVSLGFVSIGAIGIGVLAIGTVGLGLVSFGACAMGYQAFSSLSSLGWHSAVSGGFAMAKEAAIGPIAMAQEVNNALAGELANLGVLNASYLWVLGIMTLLVIAPAIWHAKKVRHTMKG